MRLNFQQRDGALQIQTVHGLSDLSSLRLSLQAAAAVGAPFVLALATSAIWQQPGAGLVIGTAFATAMIIRTITEAQQMDAEHQVKIEHARRLSQLEADERKALIPRRRQAGRQARPAIAQPVPDPEEEDRVLLASDARFVYELGIRQSSFARASFVKVGQPRLKLPSGDELTRPKFEQIIASLLADNLLVRGLDGSPTLPGNWLAGGQAGGQRDFPQRIADDAKRVGE